MLGITHRITSKKNHQEQEQGQRQGLSTTTLLPPSVVPAPWDAKVDNLPVHTASQVPMLLALVPAGKR